MLSAKARQDALKTAMEREVFGLLSIHQDAKTIKGEKFGILTGVVFLAPADTSGHEMCPGRTPGCTEVCLFTAGHGAYSNVQAGRLRKTYQFILREKEFMTQLAAEIAAGVARAERAGMDFAVRLNGTSDIAYEHIPVEYQEERFDNMFQVFPDVQFYDYTKVFGRLPDILKIPNYHITYSYAETEINRLLAQKAIDMGVSLAVVFEELPETYLGLKVINGDETDIRFWDDRDSGPVVVGLVPKGQARYDDSGFVVKSK